MRDRRESRNTNQRPADWQAGVTSCRDAHQVRPKAIHFHQTDIKDQSVLSPLHSHEQPAEFPSLMEDRMAVKKSPALQTLIEGLQEDLSREYQAIIAYTVYS